MLSLRVKLPAFSYKRPRILSTAHITLLSYNPLGFGWKEGERNDSTGEASKARSVAHDCRAEFLL